MTIVSRILFYIVNRSKNANKKSFFYLYILCSFQLPLWPTVLWIQLHSFSLPLNVPKKVEEVSSGTTIILWWELGTGSQSLITWLKKESVNDICQRDLSIRGVEIHNSLYSEENGPQRLYHIPQYKQIQYHSYMHQHEATLANHRYFHLARNLNSRKKQK